jgi:hypothetical protein
MMQVSVTRLTILGMSVFLLVPFIVVTGFAASDANNDGVDDFANQQLPGGALRPDAPIPNPSWALWVNRAGALCKDITPSLAAAQVDTESSWNPTAVARNPADRGGDAMGLAQFQQGTWDSWGRDFDGDGINSPFDPEDAVMALGTLMCDLIRWARAGIKDGSLAGDPLDLSLAAYFCGRGCVSEAGGVPGAGLAHEYPAKVRSRIARYAAGSAEPAPRDPDGSWPEEGCSIRPDPTTGKGCVTPRLLHLIQQADAAGFPKPGCYRVDDHGEHPKGRACDWMMTAGGVASGAQKARGDAMAKWAVANADGLAITYVIWFRMIWTQAEGWHAYNNPWGGDDPSGWHTNHVHISIH